MLFAAAAAAYVALRFEMNHEYKGAPWDALVRGTAQLPFGHRVLVPWLLHPLVDAGVSVRRAFMGAEWLATMGAMAGVVAALHHWLPRRVAVLGGLALLPVLGLAFLLQFRWPVFYPWDTPAIACVAWGVAWTMSRHHGRLLVLTALGAANRESAMLVPVLLVVLRLHEPEERADAVRWAVLMIVAGVLVRFAISVVWSDNVGAPLHLRVDGDWRLLNNLRWLRDPKQLLQLLGAFCALPVAWPGVRRFMPPELRRVELVIVATVAALSIVANVYEPRAFGEPLVLAYVGVAVGGWRWTQGGKTLVGGPSEAPKWIGLVDRWGVAAVAGLWCAGAAWFLSR